MSNTPKHTPEPWTTAAADDHECIIGPDGRYIFHSCHFSTKPIPKAEKRANARLAAAAPETARQRDILLAQLKRNRQGYSNMLELDLVTRKSTWQSIREVIKEIDAVIVECKGGDS